MKWVADTTGRFHQRPHYTTAEIENECEALVQGFFAARGQRPSYPLATNDLIVLLESHSADLDMYADLSSEGSDVEGLTCFDPRGAKPTVYISASLSGDPGREHRLRTTLAHELGHVRLHGFLVPFDAAQSGPRCTARVTAVDWMEWQAAYASSALLMPRRQITEIVRNTAGAPASDLILQVRRDFGVSAEAARVRLAQAGVAARGTRIVGVSHRRDWFKTTNRKYSASL